MLGLSAELAEVEGVTARLADEPGERRAILRRRPRDDPRQGGGLRDRHRGPPQPVEG